VVGEVVEGHGLGRLVLLVAARKAEVVGRLNLTVLAGGVEEGLVDVVAEADQQIELGDFR
jgi:hypothetical protein